MNWQPPRDEILATMDRIYRYRMTTTSGGNISILDDAGDLWITPARIDKGSLRRTDIVCVRADGRIEGTNRPSSEFPFHREVYRARPDLRAVVHAHPAALVAFSMVRKTPNTRLFPQARHVCGEPGFAPYALPGSQALGVNIAQSFAAGTNCVILENHGVAVAGANLNEAFQRFEALEFAAKTLVKANTLGEVKLLTDAQMQFAASRRIRVSPAAFPSPGSMERELRKELCDFVRRGCRQRLLISTEGSFSARLDDSTLLITPSQRDRDGLEPFDFVAVRHAECEAGKQPSRALHAHQAIYRRHPEIKAIVFAHPVNSTAYSITNTPLDSRTIPESYLFLRDVCRVPYGLQYGDGTELAERISPRRPVALIENDGVLVLGTSVLDAFDRLEVLEATAEASLLCQPLGAAQAMSDAVLDELRAAFFPNEPRD